MKHYVVTRLGILFDKWWYSDIEERYELFLKTSCKSFEQSEVKPIRIFLVDVKHKELQKKLKEYGVVLSVTKYDYAERLLEFLNKEHDWYTIVTRLDSDDYISPKYLGLVQEKSKMLNWMTDESNYRISYTNWIIYDYKEDKSYTYNKMYTNMFMSIIHKWKVILKSAHSSWHYNFFREMRWQHIITNEPLWCLNVHWDNVSSSMGLIREWKNILIDNPNRVWKI